MTLADRLRPLVRRDRWPLLAGVTLIAVAVIGVVWILITGLLARSRLSALEGELRSLRAAISTGDQPTADRLVHQISGQAASAHSLTSGPAWWVAANLPAVGTPLQTSRTIATQADVLGAQVLPGLLQLTDDLGPQIRPASGRVNLAPLAQAQPKLAAATERAGAAVQAIRASDPSWLSYVSNGRRSALTELSKLDGDLVGANRAVGILLPMLGQHGQKRYFIGFLNEAEARGVGGIPGAFAIATVNDGHVRFERFGSDTDLAHIRARVELGPEYATHYGQDDPTGTFPNSDISPNFPDAARIWAGLWQAKTGEHVDGALAIDPTALSYLLAVTGPAQVPGGESVSAANVVELTQSGQYRRYPGTSKAQVTDRKNFLNGIAKAVSQRLVSAGKPQRLIKALSHSALERRLVVYSADPAVEKQLVAADWAGTLGPSPGRTYTGFVVNNAAGSKLDYYLKRSMTYRRTDCAAGGTATATFTLTNTAPRSGLPPYVTIRADKPQHAKPGDNRVLVTYYAAAGATIRRITLDRRQIPVTELPEGTTTTTTLNVELPAGATRRVVVTIQEPATKHPVESLTQPGVVAMPVDLRASLCH